MKYTLSRGGTYITPHGTIRADADGLYSLTDTQREHLERAFNVTAAPYDDDPPHYIGVNDVDVVAQANIEANREAAQAHADDVQRIPVPKRKRQT